MRHNTTSVFYGQVYNNSSKTLWVLENDLGRNVAHLLAPGFHTPHQVDVDGLRSLDQSAISDHLGWWKITDLTTANILDLEGKTIIRAFPSSRVNDSYFKTVNFDDTPNWGTPILSQE